MRHSKRRASTRPQRRDAGNIMAIEAAVVGMMLMTSIAFVITMPNQSPTPSINAARGPLEAQVRDLLVAMEDIPTGDRYQTVMQRAIAKAVQGNTTAFENLVDRAMPPGTECRLWLDNGHARRLVVGPSERLARESVSKSVLWRPTWAYGFLLPSLDVVSELQPLPLQGYQVAQGSLVKEHGVPITATLVTDQGTYDRAALAGVRPGATASLYMMNERGMPGFTYTDETLQWQTTPVHNKSANGTLGSGTFEVPYAMNFLNITAFATGTAPLWLVGTTVTFRDPNNDTYPVVIAAGDPLPGLLSLPWPLQGNWTYSTEDLQPLTKARLYVNATSLEGNRNWTFVVKEEGSGALPNGTRLSVRMPNTFSRIDETQLAQAGWKNVTLSDNLDAGAMVTAELDGALSGAARPLVVSAKRPASGDALYHVTAALDQGASARASFVFASTTGVVSTTNPIDHELYMSVPKPQAPGSFATWGMAFPYPRTAPGVAETVKQLDLRVADGTPLFAALNLTGRVPVLGWELVSPTHIRWTGSVTLPVNRVMGFALSVQAPAQRTPDEPSIGLPMQFPGNPSHVGGPAVTNFTMEEQERPYIHTFNVPPPFSGLGEAQKGYHRPSGAPNERSNTSVNATGVVRGMLASGTATYGVTSWGSVTALAEATRNGFGKSHLNFSASQVKIGDTFSIEIDFNALRNEVQLAASPPITSWSVELNLFDPAQPFEYYANMKPSYHGRWGANGSLEPPQSFKPDQLAIQAFNTANATILSVSHGYLNFTIPSGAFYGPHLVVAQANFVVNDALGSSMVQTVRQVGVLEVVPDSGQAASSLYWATLECWLADW